MHQSDLQPNRQADRAWFALAVLAAVNAMNFYDRQILAVLNEPIRKEWALNDFQMGVLSTAFTLVYAAAGVPLGRLSDRSSRKSVLSVGVTIWSLFTAATALAGNYTSMFALRMGVGVGEASCAPAANSLVGDLFPSKERARALAIMMLGLPVGIFLSGLVSGAVAQHLGWRAAFCVAGVPGLLLGVAMLFIVEPVRGSLEHSAAGPAGGVAHRPGNPYWIILGTPTMVWIIISGALHNFNMYAVMGFLQALIQRYHKLPLNRASVVTSVVIGAVGVIGLLAGGWAADQAQRARPGGRLIVAGLAMLIAAPCIYAGLEQPQGHVWEFMALTGIGILMMYVYYGGVYAAIQDVIEPGLRATAMALYFCAMYVVGGSFGPMVIGYFSDRFARQAMIAAGGAADANFPEEFRSIGLHSALYIVPFVCVVLSAVLFAASRTIPRDMRRLAEWREQEESEAKSPA